MEKKSDIKGKISAMLTLIDVSFANKEQRIKGINVSNISGWKLDTNTCKRTRYIAKI